MGDDLHLDLPVETLRIFMAVADTGSISAAARRIGISQPSATARLGRMERVTGLSLLRKSTTGSTLTADGERLRLGVRDVLVAVDRLDAAVRHLREDAGSSLQVAASYTIGEYLFNRWLTASRVLHEGTRVGLEITNSAGVCAAVTSDRADLGFIESPEHPADVDTQVVAHDELVLIVGRTHGWARRDAVDVAEVAATPLVTREPGSGTREYGERTLVEVAGACAAPLMQLGSTTAVKDAVEHGAGAALLSRLAVVGELSEGRLIHVPVGGADLRRQLRAVLPRGQRPSRPVESLIAAARSTGS